MDSLAFEFSGNQVRIVVIDGEPWFIGKDVCDVLELSNNREALHRLKEYERGVTTVDTLGGKQEVATISEAGLYRLVLSSRKPQAEPFQDWVCGEVLPSIRKTGKYEPASQPPMSQIQLIAAMAQEMVGIEQRQQQIEIEQTRQRLQLAQTNEAINFLQKEREEAIATLKGIERSEITPDPLSTRAKVVRLVRDYCHLNNIPYNKGFRKLYTEFRDRYHIDLLTRGKHRNKTGFTIAEELPPEETGGRLAIDLLFAVASEVFV